MKTITFKYTKADGSVSNRVLLVHSEPNKMFAGTDISSLDFDDQVLYINAVTEAKVRFLDAVKDINNQFDLNHNFRQFSPDKMSDIVVEDI